MTTAKEFKAATDLITDAIEDFLATYLKADAELPCQLDVVLHKLNEFKRECHNVTDNDIKEGI